MPSILKSSLLLILATSLATGCATDVPGYAKSRAGRASAGEMCKSVREFVRAPLDEEGLRRAWFLPFGSYADGSVDFYAPMASNPSDQASSDFYRNRVGQLTHYIAAPDFVEALAMCLTQANGFVRTVWQSTDEAARAEFTDQSAGRKVIFAASNSTTSILIAADTWSGDIEASMVPPEGCEPE